MTPIRPFRSWPIAVMVGLVAVASACGSDQDDAVVAGPIDVVTELDCEISGYPCEWADAAEASFETSLELLDGVSPRLWAGEDPAELAAELERDPRVVAVRHDETGIVLRVEGGLPVVAMTPRSAPMDIAARQLAGPAEEEDTASGRPDPDGSAVGSVELVSLAHPSAPAAPSVVASPATYDPTNEPATRRRKALVVNPFSSADQENVRKKAGVRGVEVPAELAPARTSSELASSPRFSVEAKTDDLASLEFFSNWERFDIVVVETHLTHISCKDGREMCGDYFGGAVFGTGGVEREDAAEFEFRSSDELPRGVTVTKSGIDQKYRVMYGRDFFISTYGPDGVNDTILILNVCKSGVTGSELGGLPHTLAGQGSKPEEQGAVFAWTASIDGYAADRASAQLVELLDQYGLDAEFALEQVEDLDLAEIQLGNETAKLVHLGGNLRARDTITTEVDGTELAPETDLRVSGTPEDGAPDHLEDTIVLRVDGVRDDEVEAAEIRVFIDADGEFEPLIIPGPDGPSEIIRLSSDTVDESWDGWSSHLVRLEMAELPFDLDRSDLGGTPHRWKAELTDGDRGPARHAVEPVFLKAETIRLVHPESGVDLRERDVVAVAGRRSDGRAEEFPLVVRLDYLDEDELDQYEVEVTIGDEMLDLAVNDFERVEDGFYRYAESIVLFDVTDESTPIPTSATLSRRGEPVDDHRADPVFVEVAEGEGCFVELAWAGTETLRGVGAFSGEASFDWGETEDHTGSQGRPGSISVVTFDESGRPSESVLQMALTDKEPEYAGIGFTAESGSGLPFGGTGAFPLPGGFSVSVGGTGLEAFGEISFDITENTVADGELQSIAGTFTNAGALVDDDLYGEIITTVSNVQGSFSVDRAVCPDAFVG